MTAAICKLAWTPRSRDCTSFMLQRFKGTFPVNVNQSLTTERRFSERTLQSLHKFNYFHSHNLKPVITIVSNCDRITTIQIIPDASQLACRVTSSMFSWRFIFSQNSTELYLTGRSACSSFILSFRWFHSMSLAWWIDAHFVYMQPGLLSTVSQLSNGWVTIKWHVGTFVPSCARVVGFPHFWVFLWSNNEKPTPGH